MIFLLILQFVRLKELHDHKEVVIDYSVKINDGEWEIPQLPIMKDKSKGFRPIYVYSKAGPEDRLSYGQVGQDILSLALIEADDKKIEKQNKTQLRSISESGSFKKKGRKHFFVDLAANDPIEISSSFLLEKQGWDGLCIEPNSQYWYRLSSFRTCTIIGAFVGGTKGKDGNEVDVNFKDVFGGIVGKDMDNKRNDQSTEKRNVISIQTILEETHAPRVIDFLSLDVEDAE